MSKRLWALPLLGAWLIAAGCGVAFAMPSLGGPTGIVSLPTAAVAPASTLQTALSYQAMRVKEVEAAGMYEVGQDLTAWSFQALTGIQARGELWAAYSSVTNEQDSHVWGLGAKAVLTREPEAQVSLAVGASHQEWVDALVVGHQSRLMMAAQEYGGGGGVGGGGLGPTFTGDLKVNKFYLVATKDFSRMKGYGQQEAGVASPRMLGSLGLLYLKAERSVTIFGRTESESDSLTRPFLGFEYVALGGTSLGIEYRWKDSSIDEDAVFSAVLRHQFSPEVTAEIGSTNATPVGTGLHDQRVFVRVGYNIPLKKAT